MVKAWVDCFFCVFTALNGMASQTIVESVDTGVALFLIEGMPKAGDLLDMLGHWFGYVWVISQ